MFKVITAIDEVLEKISRWGMIMSLFLILGLAVISIVLRWLGESLNWLDPVVRHLVFLSAFLGGSLAVSRGVHIRIDLLSKLLDASSSKFLHFLHKNIISLFCFVTTLVLMKASWDFYLVEKQFGYSAFLDIHSSTLVGIIPFGMGLISLRYLNQLILGIIRGVES